MIDTAVWMEKLNRKPPGEPPELYMPLDHPDFADWAALQPCEERWAMIEPHLRAGHLALDLGCNTGWFARRLTRYYLHVWGVDHDPFAIAIARELGGGARYRELELKDGVIPADAALLLSTVMYLFPEPGWKFLCELSEKVPLLFMDFGGFAAPNLPFTEDTLESQMKRHTSYTTVELLGHSALGRPLWRLSR